MSCDEHLSDPIILSHFGEIYQVLILLRDTLYNQEFVSFAILAYTFN